MKRGLPRNLEKRPVRPPRAGRDGSVDRSRCFVTDVVEVGHFEFACGGGSRLDALGEKGTITLIFRNRAAASPTWYLLTCSHVASDLLESPPVDDELDSGDCASVEGTFGLADGVWTLDGSGNFLPLQVDRNRKCP
jgi:hypothetical protein